MSRLPTEASFLKDVAHHKLTVLRDDDGLYRHLRFRVNTSWHMAFEVVTWPDVLAYRGDMGSFMFSRCPDMFGFFRPNGPGLQIDPGYWSEKVQAVDANSGIEAYSPERFKARITEWLDDDEASPALRKAVKDEVLAYAEDGEDKAMSAAIEFDFKGRRPFGDFWEASVRDYTYRFIWCCYALAWAVKQYDAHVAAKGLVVAKGA